MDIIRSSVPSPFAVPVISKSAKPTASDLNEYLSLYVQRPIVPEAVRGSFNAGLGSLLLERQPNYMARPVIGPRAAIAPMNVGSPKAPFMSRLGALPSVSRDAIEKGVDEGLLARIQAGDLMGAVDYIAKARLARAELRYDELWGRSTPTTPGGVAAKTNPAPIVAAAQLFGLPPNYDEFIKGMGSAANIAAVPLRAQEDLFAAALPALNSMSVAQIENYLDVRLSSPLTGVTDPGTWSVTVPTSIFSDTALTQVLGALPVGTKVTPNAASGFMASTGSGVLVTAATTKGDIRGYVSPAVIRKDATVFAPLSDRQTVFAKWLVETSAALAKLAAARLDQIYGYVPYPAYANQVSLKDQAIAKRDSFKAQLDAKVAELASILADRQANYIQKSQLAASGYVTKTELDAALAQYNTALANYQRVQAQLDSVSAQLDSTQITLESTQDQLRESQGRENQARAKVETLRAELATVNAELSQARQVISATEQQLIGQSTEVQQQAQFQILIPLAQRVGLLVQAKRDLEGQLATVQGSYAASQSELAQVRSSLSEKVAELTAIQSDLTQNYIAKARLAESGYVSQSELMTARAQLEQATAELNSVRGDLRSVTEDRDQVKAQLDLRIQELSDLKANIEQNYLEKARLAEFGYVPTSALAAMKAEWETVTRQLEAMTQQRDMLGQERDGLSLRVSQADQKVIELENALKTSTDEAARIQGLLDAAVASGADSTNLYTTTKAMLDEKVAALEAANAQLNDVRGQLASAAEGLARVIAERDADYIQKSQLEAAGYVSKALVTEAELAAQGAREELARVQAGLTASQADHVKVKTELSDYKALVAKDYMLKTACKLQTGATFGQRFKALFSRK